ncbi:hypothetical protein CERSUDRAFT_112443 [Gelatoporia subvermispora B]|uniref:F-box domain-containing protein n=1 Tax=Ceriporiopsis subvermispora (strain B) TaxID=914234 RepID=M2PU38_CERS8|nr:hypothetical protein CERSUDRAFT_112443 [Gelatoporia subvermispora B]
MRKLSFCVRPVKLFPPPLTGRITSFVDIIRPFFVLSRLRSIHLRITHYDRATSPLGEDELFALADAWPEVEVLRLELGKPLWSDPDYRNRPPIRPSVNCIARFALKCRDLKSLSLPAVELQDRNLWVDIPLGSQHGLRWLQLGCVLPLNYSHESLDASTQFLQHIFPSASINGLPDI